MAIYHGYHNLTGRVQQGRLVKTDWRSLSRRPLLVLFILRILNPRVVQRDQRLA